MPYLMPHEDVFLIGIGVLIAVLLVLRIYLARRGARPPRDR